MTAPIFAIAEGTLVNGGGVQTFNTSGGEFGALVPRAAIVYAFRCTSAETVTSGLMMSIGFIDDTGTQNVVAGSALDNDAGTKNVFCYTDNQITAVGNGVVTLISETDGSVVQDWTAELVADGIRFTENLSDQDIYFQAVLIGGAGVLNAAVAGVDTQIITGDYSDTWVQVDGNTAATEIGFQPNLIFMASANYYMDESRGGGGLPPGTADNTHFRMTFGYTGDHQGLGTIKQNSVSMLQGTNSTTQVIASVRNTHLWALRDTAPNSDFTIVEEFTATGAHWSNSTGRGFNLLYLTLDDASCLHIGSSTYLSGETTWESGAAGAAVIFGQVIAADGVHVSGTSATDTGSLQITNASSDRHVVFSAQAADNVGTSNTNMYRTSDSWGALDYAAAVNSATLSIASEKIELNSISGWGAYDTFMPYLMITEPAVVETGLPVYLQEAQVSAAYLGDTVATALYKGDTQLYP